MARVRQREAPVEGEGEGEAHARARAQTRQGALVATDVAQLLRARSFRIGPGAPQALARVAGNLQAFGGAVDGEAAAWIGEGTPPDGVPAISLADEPATLGPRSFGFLNNIDGICPLAAPMADRPRRGGVALVVPRRDALPEVVPLLLRRRLGVSWLISVGDGDPADVVRFLSVDPGTTGILLALGRGARAVTLNGVLGGKQAAILELLTSGGPGREGALCRAVARRAGVPAVSELEEWLAHGALMDAVARPRGADGGAEARRARVVLLVLGAGADFVATEARRAGLAQAAPVEIESGDEEALRAALAQAQVEADLIVLCGDPEETVGVVAGRPLLRVDPSQPERLRAILRAVAQRPRTPAEARPIQVKPDAERVSGVWNELPPPLYVGGQIVLDEPLSDHDAKRLLHAYGAKVSRQAPANTVTAVLRVAGRINLPVVLVPPAREGTQEPEVVCQTQADLKRQATLLLSRHPHILVREVFPDAPRLRLTVSNERGLGGVMRLGGEAALVPLQRGEARELSDAVAAEHGVDGKGLTELLGQVSSCAHEQPVTLDLQIHLAAEPAVVSASGTLRRKDAAGAAKR
jgi:hypothetical protein